MIKLFSLQEMAPPQSLWSHGYCDNKGRARAGGSIGPPQSLWSHGYCDSGQSGWSDYFSDRLNLFGVTGTATAGPRNAQKVIGFC